MGRKVVYKIDMKLLGRATQLPDSQKIFGALVYLLSNQTTAEQASEFTAKIKTGEFHMALSDMLPLGYVPLPQPYLLERLAGNGLTEGRKAVYQAVKKKEYVREAQLKEVLAKPELVKELYPYVTVHSSQQIHAAIDSLQYHIQGLDPNVYSVPEITVLEITKTKGWEEERQMTRFYFYLELESGEPGSSLMRVLEAAKACRHTFFLGPRASQGLNLFEIENIETLSGRTEGKGKCFLNMGMLLPENVDFKNSYLKLFTSERRPYHSGEGWDTGKKKKFISFIQKGSVICLKEEKKPAGKAAASPFEEYAVVFGHAFLYPLQEDGRKL